MRYQQISLLSVILLLVGIGGCSGEILGETIQSARINIDLKGFIEKFRKTTMLTGDEKLGIPPMEPLKLNHLPIDIDHAIGKFNGTLDKLKIDDLSKFILNDATMNILPTRPKLMHIDISFPTINISEGLYQIDGIIGDLFKLFGKGPFTMTLSYFDMIIDGTLEYQDGLQLKTLDIKAKLGKSLVNFKNIEGGGQLEEIFNNMISDILPEALDILWPEIKPALIDKIFPIANELLKKLFGKN